LPPAALTDALRAALTPSGPFPLQSLALLAVWTVLMVVIAVKTFRWE